MAVAATHGGVVVVGSINHDVLVRTPRFPEPGETVMGESVVYGLGGKGANQAVAAALTGTPTHLVATVGSDALGEQLLASLSERGVLTDLVQRAGGAASGTAIVTIDGRGENEIVVIAGANELTSPERVAAAARRLRPAVAVVQGEVPLKTIAATVHEYRALGALTVLNLAPYLPLPAELIADFDVLVVNRTEAGQLLACATPASLAEAQDAARALAALGPQAIVTLGDAGTLVATAGKLHCIPAEPATVIDTTGAGDAFVGVLAAGLATGLETHVAARVANRAGARAVEHVGAAQGYPPFDLTLA